MEKLPGIGSLSAFQHTDALRAIAHEVSPVPEGTTQRDIIDVSGRSKGSPSSIGIDARKRESTSQKKSPASGTPPASTLVIPAESEVHPAPVIRGETYQGIEIQDHNGLLVMIGEGNQAAGMVNGGNAEWAAEIDPGGSMTKDPWSALESIETRYLGQLSPGGLILAGRTYDLGEGVRRVDSGDGSAKVTGLEYNGQPAVCMRTKEGALSLGIDLEAASRSMRQDIASPLARQKGSGTMTLREGHPVEYTLFSGPSGTQRFDVRLPDGRKFQIYADKSITDSAALEKSVADCADAVRRGPSSTRQRQGLYDSLDTLYLFPSLGVARNDALAAQGMGPYSIAGAQATDSHGIAIPLDCVRNPDDALMGIGSALYSGPGPLSYRRLKPGAYMTGEKMSLHDPRLGVQWPENVQIFAGARQGQTLPTYASWLTKAFDRLPEEKSLPDALSRLDDLSLLDDDDDGLKKGYNPVTSSDFGKGWVRGEQRPRIALIVRGHVQEGEPNALSLNAQVTQLKSKLREHYGDVQILELKQAKPAEVEEAMKKMKEFAASHPGAESLIFVGSHGSENDPDPRSSRDALNGSLEGSFTLTEPQGRPWQEGQLGEATVKKWADRYLGGFSTNLFMLYCCDAGAWIA
jgi:hypothetical protein